MNSYNYYNRSHLDRRIVLDNVIVVCNYCWNRLILKGRFESEIIKDNI